MIKSTKITLSIVLVIMLLVGIGHPIQAVETEATPSPSASTTETTKNLKERIEKIVDEKRDQVEGTINDLSQRKRGFIGEVQRVTQESITIKNHKGTQIISLSSDVEIVKAGKTIPVDSISVGDWTIVIGTIQDDAFTPKRIIVSSQTLRPRDHVVTLGSITTKTSKELTVLSRNGDTVSFQTTTKTAFQDLNGDQVKADRFLKDMQVLVVGYETADGKTATTVRAIVSLDSEKDE
jgi:hypothetical protein